ncbi:DNA/RNA non-specific endonuclease [Mariniflexile ostreae]|uniref:Endonuclease n=1 Tax=Mariniflexile ostreae TaxID=1520892 RepID=A0ABV5FCR7_9FLAO
MMKRFLYSIMAITIGLVVYGYEYFLDEKERTSGVEVGKQTKKYTNTFLLPISTTNQMIHHENYSLSYSEPHEQAEWVAYELKKEHLTKTRFNRPYFEVDEAVKTGAAHWRNYKKSGYDRGHLCPAGDRTFSKAAYNETFLTSNISPQRHDFNSGIWNTLEQKVRYWAHKYDGVFVVTGGVLKGEMKTIGTEKVAVPNQFYKILIDNNTDKIKMIAFLFPHENSKKPLHEFVVSVDSIEKLTGIDFFPQLEDTLENRLEASSNYKAWRFN